MLANIQYISNKQNKETMTTYRVWKNDYLEIRNYGGSTYNVYCEGNEIDCFTLYNKEIELSVINDYFQTI